MQLGNGGDRRATYVGRQLRPAEARRRTERKQRPENDGPEREDEGPADVHAPAAAFGGPRQRHELHFDLAALRRERDALELDVLIELRGDGGDVFGKLPVERGDGRLDAVDGLRRALHVGRLFHRPSHAPCRGRRAPERADADRLAPEQRTEQRRAHRHGGLHLLIGRLLLFPFDRLLRPPQPLGERGLLRRILPAHRLDRLVARRAPLVLQPDPEVALGFSAPSP